MKRFNKRIYNSFREFLQDFKFIVRNKHKIKKIQEGSIINHSFRQRLMMAVTVVNGCRYCTYYHTRLSLKSGVSNAELQSLLSGVVEECPESEILALLYAQHWAESNGKPDTDYKKRISEYYGLKVAEAIELTLRTIRFGNLSGNSFDYLLYRISFGKFEIPKNQKGEGVTNGD